MGIWYRQCIMKMKKYHYLVVLLVVVLLRCWNVSGTNFKNTNPFKVQQQGHHSNLQEQNIIFDVIPLDYCSNYEQYANNTNNDCKDCTSLPGCAWCDSDMKCMAESAVSSDCRVQQKRTTTEGTYYTDPSKCPAQLSGTAAVIIFIVIIVVCCACCCGGAAFFFYYRQREQKLNSAQYNATNTFGAAATAQQSVIPLGQVQYAPVPQGQPVSYGQPVPYDQPYGQPTPYGAPVVQPGVVVAVPDSNPYYVSQSVDGITK